MEEMHMQDIRLDLFALQPIFYFPVNRIDGFVHKLNENKRKSFAACYCRPSWDFNFFSEKIQFHLVVKIYFFEVKLFISLILNSNV